jgi:FtsP/CotA-like multicopper oxidase with cupredoxin domain
MNNQSITTREWVGLTRRNFLQAGGLAAAGGAVAGLSGRAFDLTQTGHPPSATSHKLASAYTFRLEKSEVDPAGKAVKATLIGGGLPGPEIRIKEGELLRVKVQNAMDEPTTIHWHGLLLPAAMDGVPGVTQAPIPPGGVFLYEYPIRQSGTFWYHSHVELQEQSGLSGPFIIEPKEEPLKYDLDYVLFVTDWLNSDPNEVIPRLRKEGMAMREKMKPGMKMKMGEADLADVKYDAFLLNGRSNSSPWSCAARPGDRIRFRLINGSASTFFRFMLDGHGLTITHTDGEPVRPVEVDNLLVGSGECYDLLVKVGASGAYTIRAEAQDGSGAALGVLHTRDAKPVLNPKPPVWGKRTLDYAQLRAPHPTRLPAGPERRYTLALSGDMMNYVWKINDQVYPQADPLLIKEGERVIVEVKNNTQMFHPMHLHGHFYRLLSGQGGPSGEDFAPRKHTAWVAPDGTLKFEFFADNPGKWFFHCHNLYHMITGMAREWHYTL